MQPTVAAKGQAGPPFQPVPTAAFDTSVESYALKRITWFAILQIASLVIGFSMYLAYLPSIFSMFPTSPSGTTLSPSVLSSFLQGMFTFVSAVVVVSVAIGLMAVFLLFGAFRSLSRLDSPSFSTPATLTILLLVGYVMSGIGTIPLFLTLSSFLSQIAATQTTPFVGTMWPGFIVALALLVIGGILAIIGVIGGEILGLWRVGTRYDSTIIKVGAIFVVIPLLNYVGPILLLIGSLDAKKKFESQLRS
jgi:hypothetical protein